jgi:solute carrier family 25 iron transporter 28/37
MKEHSDDQEKPFDENTKEEEVELDSDEELEWEEWKPEQISFGNHMIAGSMAGLAEHVSLFPMDTIKTHIQCQKCGSVTPFQTWSYTIRMIHQEGLFRLWRGVTAMFAGCIPGKFIDLIHYFYH